MPLIRRDRYREDDVPLMWFMTMHRYIALQRRPNGWCRVVSNCLGRQPEWLRPEVLAPKFLSLAGAKAAVDHMLDDTLRSTESQLKCQVYKSAASGLVTLHAKETTMPKLHEVLAVEAGLQTTAKQTNEETIKTFGKRDEHFVGTVTQLKHFAEDDRRLDVTEAKEMVTTVFEKLLYNTGPNVRALDAYLQKEATNQAAVADLIVGDQALATAVPATVLLGLETRLVDLRRVYEAIPTLAPGPHWVPDTDKRARGVYRAENVDVGFRTRKTTKPVILVPPTEHHPAQVDKVVEDVPIARIEKQQWSGMITPAEKSELLARIDRLLRAVKRARQRANATEVVTRKIGAALFGFIHDGIVA